MKGKDLTRLLLLAAIWGSSFMFLKIVTPAIGVSMTMGTRILLAAAVMLAVLAMQRRLPDYRRFWRHYLAVGILNLVLPFTLISYAIGFLNSTMSAMINASTPLFTMVIASLWLRQKMETQKLAGLVVGIAGLVVLIGWIPIEFNRQTIIAVLCSLLASISYGLGNVYSRIYLSQSQPAQTATGQLSMAALIALPLLVPSFSTVVIEPGIALAIAMLAIVCTALAYTIYFRLIASAGSGNTAVVSLLVPVFSILWGAIFLDETVTPVMILGLAMILLSLGMILHERGKTIMAYCPGRIIYKRETRMCNVVRSTGKIFGVS